MRAFAALILLFAASACGPAPILLDGAYGGPLLAETEAVAGLVVQGAAAAFFVAGKGESLESHTRWFTGDLDPEKRRALLQADGWSVDLRPDGLDVLALLTDPENANTTFRMSAGSGESPEGLYSAMDEGCRLGVVIHTPDGTTSPEAQGVWCSAGGTHKEVTVGDLAADPIEVTVDVDGESRTIAVDPVDPGAL
jgi:hypothetical protein